MGQASAMVLVLVDTVLALLQVDNTAVNVGPSRSLVHHHGQLLLLLLLLLYRIMTSATCTARTPPGGEQWDAY